MLSWITVPETKKETRGKAKKKRRKDILTKRAEKGERRLNDGNDFLGHSGIRMDFGRRDSGPENKRNSKLD